MKKLFLVWVLVMAFLSSSLAQTRPLTGKVTSSEDGAPLPGVSVSLKGTSRGTTTAFDGTFKISALNSFSQGNNLTYLFFKKAADSLPFLFYHFASSI